MSRNELGAAALGGGEAAIFIVLWIPLLMNN